METINWLENEMKKDDLTHPEYDADTVHGSRGTLTFVLMAYRLKAAWLFDGDPVESIEHAAWTHA